MRFTTSSHTIFQSTLPARGATLDFAVLIPLIVLFQSTLPARGATHGQGDAAGKRKISIHAPRTGSDKRCIRRAPLSCDFNPRSPHGERPAVEQRTDLGAGYFNPRSPHGERHKSPGKCYTTSVFQSTLPARGATLDERSTDCTPENFNPRSPHGERP